MSPAIYDEHYTSRSDRFAAHLAQLIAYLEASGGRYPSRVLAKDTAERQLAVWVMCARASQRVTGFVLTPAQRRQLAALPGWTWTTDGTPRHQERRRERLESSVALVTAAARRAGTVEFPRGFRLPDGRNPVEALRFLRRTREQGRMPPELARRLERLPGWTWKRRLPDPVPGLDGWLALLDRFIAKHGHARVPVHYCVGTAKLGRWVSRMRTFHRRGHLAPEMAAALEARPEWRWNPLGVEPPRLAPPPRATRRAVQPSSRKSRPRGTPNSRRTRRRR